MSAGTYVLKVVRDPHSPTKPAAVIGYSLVEVHTSDVANVVVTIRRDTSITGTFRMESTQTNAVWPTEIVVGAYLALDGSPLLDSVGAEGAQGGKFILRNAFGPRVLRCGYTLAPGSRWWPSRVLLNGVDVTNKPTDFSDHENARLEVFFTQQPARIEGTVTDARGEVIRAPWILAVSADRRLWQHWATTSLVAQGNTKGSFSFAALPGRYLITAVPQTTFDSWPAARRQILQHAVEGVPVNLDETGRATVTLTMQQRK